MFVLLRSRTSLLIETMSKMMVRFSCISPTLFYLDHRINLSRLRVLYSSFPSLGPKSEGEEIAWWVPCESWVVEDTSSKGAMVIQGCGLNMVLKQKREPRAEPSPSHRLIVCHFLSWVKPAWNPEGGKSKIIWSVKVSPGHGEGKERLGSDQRAPAGDYGTVGDCKCPGWESRMSGSVSVSARILLGLDWLSDLYLQTRKTLRSSVYPSHLTQGLKHERGTKPIAEWSLTG